MGKFTINGPFSIAMLVYQRVTHKLPIATVATQAVAPSHVAPHVSRARSPAVAPRRQASALGGPALGGRATGIAWQPSWAGCPEKTMEKR